MGELAAFVPNTYVESFLGPLREVLTRDDVNEVVINPDGGIFVEESGSHHMQMFDLDMTESAIRQLGSALAGETQNSIGEHHPIVSGRVMVWGAPLRIQVVIPPAIESGVSVSIRRYSTKKLEPVDIQFVEGGQIDIEARRRERHTAVVEMANQGRLQDLMRHAIDERFNIVISGGTSSGKTSLPTVRLDLSYQAKPVLTMFSPMTFRLK